MSASYYDFATVGKSDTFMKQCLRMKGRWKALSRDSDEWRLAQLEEMNARHHRMFDQALKQDDDSE